LTHQEQIDIDYKNRMQAVVAKMGARNTRQNIENLADEYHRFRAGLTGKPAPISMYKINKQMNDIQREGEEDEDHPQNDPSGDLGGRFKKKLSLKNDDNSPTDGLERRKTIVVGELPSNTLGKLSTRPRGHMMLKKGTTPGATAESVRLGMRRGSTVLTNKASGASTPT